MPRGRPATWRFRIDVHPFEDPVAGIAEVATVLDRPGPLFAFIYLDTIDSIGHVLGPDSPEFDAARSDCWTDWSGSAGSSSTPA